MYFYCFNKTSYNLQTLQLFQDRTWSDQDEPGTLRIWFINEATNWSFYWFDEAVCLYQTADMHLLHIQVFRTVYGAAETLGKCSTLFPNSLSDHPAMWIKCLLSKFPSIPIFIHNWCSSVEHEYVMSAYVVSFLDHSAMIVIGLTLPISLSGLDSELLLLVSDD